MKISRSTAVALLAALDVPGVEEKGYTNKRLAAKLGQLKSLVKGKDLGDEDEVEKLVQGLLKKIDAGEAIEVVEVGEGNVVPNRSGKPAKKKAKVAAGDGEEHSDEDESEEEEEDEGDEEDAAEDSEEEEEESEPAEEEEPVHKKNGKAGKDKKKGAKIEPPKKKGKDGKDKEAAPKKKGVGIIATIVDLLSKASEKKPLTKEKIFEKLTEKFGERPSMETTVSLQVPNKIRTDKGIEVQTNKKGGYWILPEDLK